MHALIDIPNQMLEDGAFDMQGEIRGEAPLQRADGPGVLRCGGLVSRPNLRGYFAHQRAGNSIE